MYRGEAEREVGLGEGDEMVEEKPLPKYENIEKLMQEIDKNTDEEAHKFKVQEMKRVADMLEKKCTALEEGDDADHIDQKKLKQMKKDIMTLRKGMEKLEKLGEKKFAKKETKAELKEGFDLRKFLVENKLTSNSRMVSENEEQVDELFGFGGGTKVTEKDTIRIVVREGSITFKPVVRGGTSVRIEQNDSDFDHIKVGNEIRIVKSFEITAGKPFYIGNTEVIVDKLFLNGTETKSVTLPK